MLDYRTNDSFERIKIARKFEVSISKANCLIKLGANKKWATITSRKNNYFTEFIIGDF